MQAWEYLIQGRIGDAIMDVLNNYFVFGTFWLLLGFSIFAVIQSKTRNMNISLIITSLYFIVVSPYMLPVWFLEYTKYVQMLLGLAIGYGIYKLIKG